jgi:AraC-like DNA-binding protein
LTIEGSQDVIAFSILEDQMDENIQSSFHMSAFSSGATGPEDHRRDLEACARTASDALAGAPSLGSDGPSPSNGQLCKGMNALIEALKSALEGDGVSARYYIGSASASLVDTGRGGDTPAAVSETSVVRSCGGLAPWQVRRLKTHMEENLGGTIYCEDLARLVCLSLSHFMRAFKESFGCAPHAFLIRRRMERAQGLMLTTDEALGQIALMCGLADQSHLTRLFQKWVGESPAAWRRARMNRRTSTDRA